MAVGDSSGKASLSQIEESPSLSFVSAIGEDEVDVVSLDDHATDLIAGKCLSLIKIDVEESEPEVLLGAQKLIRAHRPALHLEINRNALQRRDHSAQEIAEILAHRNYAVTFYPGGNHWQSDYSDLFCTPVFGGGALLRKTPVN